MSDFEIEPCRATITRDQPTRWCVLEAGHHGRHKSNRGLFFTFADQRVCSTQQHWIQMALEKLESPRCHGEHVADHEEHTRNEAVDILRAISGLR